MKTYIESARGGYLTSSTDPRRGPYLMFLSFPMHAHTYAYVRTPVCTPHKHFTNTTLYAYMRKEIKTRLLPLGGQNSITTVWSL